MNPKKIGRHQWVTMNRVLRFPGTAGQFLTQLRILAAPTYYPKTCPSCGVRTGWATVENSSASCEACNRHMLEEDLKWIEHQTTTACSI